MQEHKVLERLAVIRTYPGGDTLELTRIQWGDDRPVYDLRRWTPEGKPHVGGFKLTAEQLSVLKRVLDLCEEL